MASLLLWEYCGSQFSSGIIALITIGYCQDMRERLCVWAIIKKQHLLVAEKLKMLIVVLPEDASWLWLLLMMRSKRIEADGGGMIEGETTNLHLLLIF